MKIVIEAAVVAVSVSASMALWLVCAPLWIMLAVAAVVIALV
jgi:hypothetical protein